MPRAHTYYPIQDLRTAERDFHLALGAPPRDGPSKPLPLHKVFEPLPTKASKANPLPPKPPRCGPSFMTSGPGG